MILLFIYITIYIFLFTVPIPLFMGLWDLINIYIGIRGEASQNSEKHVKTDIPYGWVLCGFHSSKEGFTRNHSYFLSFFVVSCKTRRKIPHVPISQN